MNSFLSGPLECLNPWFHPFSQTYESQSHTPTEETTTVLQPETISSAPLSETETTPVLALDGAQKDIPLEVLLRLVMMSKTKQYENLAQNKFKLIEELNKKMKSIDSAINKISNMLNDTKGLDLTRGEMPQLIKELEALGIEIPKNKKMSFEQASSFVRTIENKRDEHDRDMKMGQSKFQETLKDLESIRQVLFQMMSYLRETLVKITSGMRAS